MPYRRPTVWIGDAIRVLHALPGADRREVMRLLGLHEEVDRPQQSPPEPPPPPQPPAMPSTAAEQTTGPVLEMLEPVSRAAQQVASQTPTGGSEPAPPPLV